MKELAGGIWICGLVAGCLGFLGICIVLIILGALVGAGSWYRELEDERRAASWRSTYPSYKY